LMLRRLRGKTPATCMADKYASSRKDRAGHSRKILRAVRSAFFALLCCCHPKAPATCEPRRARPGITKNRIVRGGFNAFTRVPR
jgi:hypothetical protein